MNDSQFGISVIIPLFNKANTIERAIDSFLHQNVDNKELIVVDDGSTDGSESVISKYNGQIKFVKQENAGPSAARNNGVSHSSYSHLVFLDADDELLDGCLASHMAAFSSHPALGLSLAPFIVNENDGKERIELLTDRINGQAVSSDLFTYVDYFNPKLVINISCSAFCVSKETFDQAGGFDSQLHCWEITDFLSRAAAIKPSFAVLDKNYVLKHEAANNSQFEKFRKNPENLLRFGSKLIDISRHVPSSSRHLIHEQIVNIFYLLALTHSSAELKLFAGQLCDKKELSQLAGKLCMLAKLPGFLVKLILQLRFPSPGSTQ